LYRKELTGEQLSKMIETVQKRTKEVAPNVPVGFADSWNKIQDGTADPAVAQSDLVYVFDDFLYGMLC
jgi:glucan 1,3-beta-glucosidase